MNNKCLFIIILNLLIYSNCPSKECFNYLKPKRMYSENTNILNFMNSNFTEFVKQYNENHVDFLNASYIEYSRQIYNYDNNEYCYYFDFNGNNGYAIIDNSKKIYTIKLVGDINEIEEYSGEVYFSKYYGLYYYDEDEIRMFQDSLLNNSTNMIINSGTNQEGRITDVDNYVNDLYPDYIYQNDQDIINNFDKKSQYSNSIYHKYNNTGYYSESNCALNAIYSMVNNLASYNYNMNACDRLYGFIDYSNDVINDPLYSVYGIGATTIENGFTWKVNSDTIDNIPLLYLKIRNFGLMYDYDPILGFETRYISEVIKHIYNDAGHSIPTVNAQSNFENLEDEINSNISVIVSAYNSPVYSNHSMVVYGYKKYLYENEWFGFIESEYRYLLKVNDGSIGDYWFDPSQTSSCVFTYCDKSTLDWPTC